ncbi:hypothetical protein [Rhizobium redzepovicii]|uniref:hypothetical protein n=1 Tax=Rhizobium redzepovicii TaxID=2867518 RepID=UPI001C935239|nr:hypothetical protein [Rhizobium redzepovicii]MBY4616153.1 hypothetical protein [Rhizobium redzepovicii]
MDKIATIGLDIAKQVFQVHGTDAQAATLFNRKLRRSEVRPFFEKLSPCIVARPDAKAEFERRKAAIGKNLEDGKR